MYTLGHPVSKLTNCTSGIEVGASYIYSTGAVRQERSQL